MSTRHRRALDGRLQTALVGPIFLVVGSIYLIIAALHPILVPGPNGRIVSATSGVVGAIFLLAASLERRRRCGRWAYQATVSVVIVGMGISLLHLGLTAQLWQSTNVILLVLVAGVVLGDPRWFAVTVTTAVAGWAYCMSLLPPDPLTPHFAFALVAAFLIASTAVYGRVRFIGLTSDLMLREKRHRRALAVAQKDADAGLEAKSSFLAAMSHELRTPLQGILGNSEALVEGVEGDMTPAQCDRVGRITDEGRHMLRLVTRIMDAAAITGMNLVLDRVDAGALAATVAKSVEAAARRAGVRLLTVSELTVPAVHATIDARRMRQAVREVLDNAIRFTPRGGTVSITTRVEDAYVCIDVADDGAGIAKGQLSGLAEPFVQAEPGDSRPFDGAGVGLALALGILRAHLGSLELSSTLGRGTIVSMRFPHSPHARLLREDGVTTVERQWTEHPVGAERQPDTRAPDHEELRQKARYLKTINEFALALLSVSTVEEIVWVVAKNAVAQLGFEDCVVYLVDEAGACLVQRAAHGPKNPRNREISDPITIPIGLGIVGSVAETGEPELVRDTRVDPRYITDDAVRLSELAVPILLGGKVIGVVDSEHHEVGFYTDEHLQILTTIASMASTKLDRAIASEQLQATVARLTAAETRLEDAAVDLEHARDRAEQASQAKSDFLAVMSHEVRTPMNAILGMTELVLETDLSHDQRDLLQIVQTNGDALLEIVGHILDHSKLAAGAVQLQKKDFSVADLVEGVSQALVGRAACKAVEITTVLSPALPAVLKGDPSRFRQVLVNLLGNAVKFTPNGGRVLVRAERHPTKRGFIRVQVSDTGVGISPADVESIFEPFFQADAGLAREFEGSGLGLGISHSIVTLMGGTIDVSSEIDKGTSFVVEVPFEASDQSFACRRDSDQDFSAFGARVVSSRPWIREAVVAALESLGIDLSLDDTATAAEHRFVIVDGGGPDEVCHVTQLKKIARDGERILLLRPHGVRALSSFVEQGIGVVSNPLSRRKLAAALIDQAGVRPVTTDEVKRPIRALGRTVPRILVVEDSADSRRFVRRVLENASFRVDLAECGEEGVRLAANRGYDVILTDVQMPGMDGFQMTRRIRTAEAAAGRARVPIIAQSAHAGEGFRERCLESGMDEYVSKPFRGPQLTQIIDTLLDRVPSASMPRGKGVEPSHATQPECVLIDQDISDLVAEFIEDWRGHAMRITALLDAGEFETLVELGHRLKGTGGAYGFPELTRIGGIIEAEGEMRRQPELRIAADELATYLETVQWRVG